MLILFQNVLLLSLTASFVALGVMVVRLAFSRCPKWIMCLLWGLVALRLVMPLSLESRFSLIPESVASGQVIADMTRIPEQVVIQNTDVGFDAAPSDWIQPIETVDHTTIIPADEMTVKAKVSIVSICAAVWAVGTGLMFFYACISYLRLRFSLREATLLRDHIWQAEQVDSPFVLGFVRPRIYLSYCISESDAENVIAHENAHIARKDHWWKPLGFLLLSVHWFNPVLWLAYVLLCRDIEEACDERVVRNMGKEEKQAYALALLHCSIQRRTIAACPLAFGETGVKERVKRVMKYQKPTFWIVLIAVILCVVLVVCFLTNPSAEALPLVHSRVYSVQSIPYHNNSLHYTQPDPSALLRFYVTEDMHLQVMYHQATYVPEIDLGLTEDEWMDLGALEAFELTKENFDALCHLGNTGAATIRNIRKETVNAWRLRTENQEQIYLIQSRTGELHLAVADRNHDREPEPVIRYVYGLKDNEFTEYGLYVRSGDHAVPITVYSADVPVGNYDRYLHWLTITPGEDVCPFRTYHNGEEIRGYYRIYDARSLEPVPYHIPSGLDPQTYLFQNCDPEREYIVVMKLSAEPDAENYCFGVRFAEESNAILMAEVLEAEDWGYLVKPIGDSWEQNSMDRIEISRKNLRSDQEPQPGDILRIEFDGLIQATYPGRIPNPYSITVAERGSSESVKMIPTSSTLTGVFDRYLFLDINGEKYRYERQETLPDGIQAGEEICTVYEDSGVGDRYAYTVFSVKNVTDGSSVLVHSKEMDEMWLYCYSPAKACAPDALQQAKDAGYLVMEEGYGTCGQEQWTAFLQKAQRGEPATIIIASYYTLDPDTCSPEYYEAYREDYPWLYIQELHFDGAVYTILSEDGTSRAYEYLMCYTEPDRLNPTESIIRFVLTHDDKVTWEDLFHGLISSYLGAYIDHYSVYTEKAVRSGSVLLPAD